MSGRANVLGRVRSALGRTSNAPVPPPPPVRLNVPQVDLETRVASFCAALDKLAAKTIVVSSQPEVDDYIREVSAGRAPVVDVNCSYEELVKAEVGVTGADFGLADTGTLVMLAKSDPRLLSLLPPVHIAVLPVNRLLSGLDELLTVLPQPAAQTASMVLITGPSRTADIEQILVRGVHGPGELHVVLIR